MTCVALIKGNAVAKRKSRQTPRQKRTLGINGTRITPRPPHKTTWVQFRVSPEEKAEMQKAAQELGVPLSDYFRELHRQAVESLRKRSG